MESSTDTSIKRKRFEVCLIRLIREQQTVIVEAENENLVRDHLKDIYDAAEGDPFDAEWGVDLGWGCDEGTHTICEVTDVDRCISGEPAFTVTENRVTRWTRPKTDVENIIAAALGAAISAPSITKKFSNLEGSTFTARFVVRNGVLSVEVSDYEDLDG